jgi:hypothetical protein
MWHMPISTMWTGTQGRPHQVRRPSGAETSVDEMAYVEVNYVEAYVHVKQCLFCYSIKRSLTSMRYTTRIQFPYSYTNQKISQGRKKQRKQARRLSLPLLSFAFILLVLCMCTLLVLSRRLLVQFVPALTLAKFVFTTLIAHLLGRVLIKVALLTRLV